MELRTDASLGDDWAGLYEPGGVAFSAERVAALLKVDLATLAEQSGLAEDQLRNDVLAPAVQGYLTTVVSVLLAAYFVSGDLDKAVAWYHDGPVFDSDSQTPEEFVRAGRADAVLAYLESIESGAVG
jgi:hypothetical protein